MPNKTFKDFRILLKLAEDECENLSESVNYQMLMWRYLS